MAPDGPLNAVPPAAAAPAAASVRVGRRVSAKRSHFAFRLAALAGDIAISLAALYGAYLVRIQIPIPGTSKLLPPENVRFAIWSILVVAAVQVFWLAFLGLYGEHDRFREPLSRLLIPALSLQLLTLAAIYFLAPAYSFPRSLVVLYVVFDGLLLVLWRSALDRLFPLPRRRALIVGEGPAADLIADTVRRHPWTGVEVVGRVSDRAPDRASPDGSAAGALPFLGPLEWLGEIVESERVDEVILTSEGSSWRDRITERIPEGWRADLLVWPSPFETMIGRLRFRVIP